MSANENTPDANINPIDDDLDLVMPEGGLYESEFWSISRHELLAGVAEELIKPKTAKEIRRIVKPLTDLGLPDSLSDLAGWADKIKKRGPRDDDDEDTKEFLSDDRNKSRGVWHYVNLPLEAEGYSREEYPTLTRDNDVVQMINECVRVLTGKSGDDEPRFSELNALRLLVHLVGDVHQPVHVGCGFIDEDGEVPKLVRNPQTVVNKELNSDTGGNKLILPIGNSGYNLHSYWDSRLGGSNPDIHDPAADGEGDADFVDDAELKRRFIGKLHRMIAQDPQPVAEGGKGEADTVDLEEWAPEWATESLIAARSAYQSLKITGPNEKNYDVEWEGREAYDLRCKPIAIDRLKVAAQNLAAMLDAIWK
jgi:hypothetical protein